MKTNEFGVYAIKCIPENSIYIGESEDIQRRWDKHIADLRSGNHHNYLLQKAYDAFGLESFTFQILNRFDEDDWTINKAKCLVLEHGYSIYYRSFYEVYNIRNTMQDYLLQIPLIQNAKSVNLVKKQIINILSNYIYKKESNQLLRLSYVGSLERQFMLNGILPKNKDAYNNLVALFPNSYLQGKTYNRQIKYFCTNANSVINDSIYLVKNKEDINNYILNNYESFINKDNIILPTCSSLRKYLLSRNIIKGELTSKSLKKIFINNNVIKNCSGIVPTDYAIESKFIEKFSPCTLSTLGIKYIMPKIFSNKWSNIENIE